MSIEAFNAHFGGSPLARRGPEVTFADDGCWLMPTRSYCRVQVANGRTYAHRISLEIKLGEPLGDLHACHHCDTPRCVNPAHLFAGTAAENHADKVRKGRVRNNPPRGIDAYNVRHTDEEVADALRSLSAGESVSSVARRLGAHRRTVQKWRDGRWRRDARRLLEESA